LFFSSFFFNYKCSFLSFIVISLYSV
jgi:hypothetical protein